VLRFLRRYSRSSAVKVLYGLLAATFVVWGAGMYHMSQVDAVAQVYDQQITQKDLTRETEQMERRMQALARGANLSGIDFRSQALNALVEQALVRHEADRLGLDVTETELVTTIMTMPELQRDGQFDRDLLERVLDFQRDRGEFETEVRQDILARRFRDLIVDGIQVTPAEVEAEYHNQNDQVDLRYVRFSADDAAKDVTVPEAELEAFRTKNDTRYLTAPSTRARYVAFAPADYVELAAPSPAQIEQYYQDHKADRFTKPEEVQARHLLVRVAPGATDADRAAARKKIDDLRARIVGGADFAAVAKEASEDPGSAARGGDLGAFSRGRMDPTFEQAAFALQPGTVSEVVETPFGLHLIQVDAHDAGGVQELPQVRDQIVATLTRERGLELARMDAEQVRRAVVGGKPLAEAAGKHPVEETEAFTESGVVPGIGRAPAFAKAAFALGDGQVSDLVEEGDAVYILEPFDRKPPALPPLAEIRERVERDAKRAAGETKAKERAERLLATAREVGLVQAAKDAGIETRQTGLFARRTGSIPQLGAVPELREAAFGLTQAQPLAPAVYAVAGDAVVAALGERKEATMAGFDAEKKALEESLLDRQRRTTYERYLDELKKRAADGGELLVKADALGPRQ
jgi:peptidyl-prolyl cis-trans isomerase D